MQHLDDAVYGSWKVEQLRRTLEHEGLGDFTMRPAIITAPATRRRARLAARHGENGIIFGFNAWRSHDVVNVAACPVLLPELESLITKLRGVLPQWLERGAECDAQITLLPDGFDVVVIGGGELDRERRRILAKIADELDIAQMSWRKWDRSPVEPVAHRRPLTVTYGNVRVPFPPASFLQATHTGESALIEFARNAVGKSGKVLDLFCGLGGFGLSMTDAKFLGFADADGPAIAALGQAAKSAKRIRVFRRNLVGSPYASAECNPFDAVIFDPPRGGAKAQAVQLAAAHVPHIVAVSCDPPSFARDAKILMNGGYRLRELQPVDQFLWSTHMEVAGWFER